MKPPAPSPPPEDAAAVEYVANPGSIAKVSFFQTPPFAAGVLFNLVLFSSVYEPQGATLAAGRGKKIFLLSVVFRKTTFQTASRC